MRRVVTVSAGATEKPADRPETTPSPPRWLVRFGYDGTSFRGWARQPGARTIEGEILRALLGRRHPGDSLQPSLEVASRTDRGVSARANALSLRSPLSGPTLLRRLNGIAPEIRFLAATPVTEDFRVRAATRRTYRYFDPRPVRDMRRRENAAALLTGSIDARSFGRGLAAGAPVWRTVETVASRPVDGGAVIEVRAPSFVWGMVRKMVTALREIDAGRLSPERLRAAVEGSGRLALPLAEPEPLVLWDVEFPVPWTFRWSGPNRGQAAARERAVSGLWSRRQVLEALATDP